MKDQNQHPDDFVPVSPSSFANAIGLRPNIVKELMDRKEIQHFIDANGNKQAIFAVRELGENDVHFFGIEDALLLLPELEGWELYSV
jgi:hypothetical protein